MDVPPWFSPLGIVSNRQKGVGPMPKKPKVPATDGTKAQDKGVMLSPEAQERIKQLVAEAPPLSDEQSARIIFLLTRHRI